MDITLATKDGIFIKTIGLNSEKQSVSEWIKFRYSKLYLISTIFGQIFKYGRKF